MSRKMYNRNASDFNNYASTSDENTPRVGGPYKWGHWNEVYVVTGSFSLNIKQKRYFSFFANWRKITFTLICVHRMLKWS